jgi:hypothetical protein
MAKSDQLTVNASVASGWVLSGHPQHQGPDRLWGGRAAGLLRVGPAAGEQIGVPAAGFSVRPAADGAAGWVAACSAR